MARIPLAEIPNAPQVAVPVLTQAQAPMVNLSGAAQDLSQKGIAQGSFDGSASGVSVIGKAVASLGDDGVKIANTLADRDARLERAQDLGNLAKIDKLRSEAFATYSSQLDPNKPQDWITGYQKVKDDVNDQISQIPLSGWGQDRLALETTDFDKKTNISLITSSAKQGTENAVSEMQAKVDRSMDARDYEGAATGLGEIYKLGGMTTAQHERSIQKLTEAHNEDTATTTIQQYAQPVAEAYLGGDHKKLAELFPYANPAQRAKYGNDAAILYKKQRADVMSSWSDIVDQTAQTPGASISDSDKQQFVESAPFKLSATDLKALDKRQNASILNLGDYNKALLSISNYTPDQDKNGLKLADIQESISEFPKANRDVLQDRLNEVNGSGRGTPVLGDAHTTLHQYSELGNFDPPNYKSMSSEDQVHSRQMGLAKASDEFDAIYKSDKNMTRQKAQEIVFGMVKHAQSDNKAKMIVSPGFFRSIGNYFSGPTPINSSTLRDAATK